MLIGIVGFAGSGKNTVGDILVNEFGFHQVAFADAVKDAVAVIFGWDRDLLQGDTNESRVFREMEDEWWSERIPKHRPVTPRKMLQLMGTEAGRDVFDYDIWINATFREIERYDALIPDWVITDVRFPNEMNAVKKAGGIVIRISRGEEPEWFNEAKEANLLERSFMANERFHDVHYSEWAWIGHPVDFEIKNDGTIHDLKEKLAMILRPYVTPDKI